MSEQAEITLLRFPENVRIRKEMYLIDPNHCMYEIIDNAVDEFNSGYAKHIQVTVQQQDKQHFPTITVWDDGRGIPTKLSNDPEHLEETQAEVALGNLTAGGKFGKETGYKTITSGLHGVGASCVNATSSSFRACIYHDGTRTVLQYAKGILIDKTIEEPIKDKKLHGTEICFVLDESLWKGEKFDFDVIKNRLKQLSYLNPGLVLSFKDAQVEETYEHINGLEDYYSHLIQNKTMLAEKDSKGQVIKEIKPIQFLKNVNDPELGNIEINIILGYSEGYASDIYGFVNSVATTGGDHYTGFNTGIARAVTSFLTDDGHYKTLLKHLSNDDCREGIVAIISIKVMYPKFEGQSKGSIKMPQVRSAVNSVMQDEVRLYMEQHPTFVKLLAEKLEKAAKSRIAAQRARDSVRGEKGSLDSSLPGKLAACSSKKPEECSLYIVEGDSAAGSAIQGRDSRTQAILPVFGKILNTEKSRPDEVVKNSKLLDVVKALKCGIGSEFNIDKIRYHKIVIMADADVDGFHISTLWITFFYRHLPEIVRRGYLYIALSPIYRVTEYIGKNKEVNHYFFDDEEFSKFKTRNKYHVSYIKGLGELQPKQLWESTMNPENRRLIRVTESDAELASQAINMCMGDDVAIRRQFIMDKADFEKVVE